MINPTQRGPFGWRNIVPQPVLVDEELEAIEETQVPFLKTKSFGTTHADTIQFDDVQYFSSHIWAKLRDCDVNSWRIRGIKLFGNRYANGIQLLYERKEELLEGPKHFGNHHDPKEFEYLFDKDEEITGISGLFSTWMHSLTVQTNKRQLHVGREDQGDESTFSIDIPAGSRAVAFLGGTGGHIHNLGLVFIPLQWSPSTNHYFPPQIKASVKVCKPCQFV
jgi:hypothetical protein